MNRRALIKTQAGIMAAGIALALLFFCSVFFILPASRSRGKKLLEKTVADMGQLKDYDLTIVEKAPKYELLFRGKVGEGDRLQGVLPEYELEVICDGNSLLMKTKEAPEWDKAEELGLQGLAGFLITPLKLLQERRDCFKGAVMGEPVDIGERSCQTVYFNVADPDAFVQRLFPQIDCTIIDELLIGVAVETRDNSLRQLRILVEFEGSEEERIERCYYLGNAPGAEEDS